MRISDYHNIWGVDLYMVMDGKAGVGQIEGCGDEMVYCPNEQKNCYSIKEIEWILNQMKELK